MRGTEAQPQRNTQIAAYIQTCPAFFGALCLAAVALVGIVGCASGSQGPTQSPIQNQPQSYAITVAAISGGVQHQTTVTLLCGRGGVRDHWRLEGCVDHQGAKVFKPHPDRHTEERHSQIPVDTSAYGKLLASSQELQTLRPLVLRLFR